MQKVIIHMQRVKDINHFGQLKDNKFTSFPIIL